MQEEQENLTVQQYFDRVKDAKNKMTSVDLDRMAESALKLLNRFTVTKQTAAASKVWFCLKNIEKERKLIDFGIDTYVWKQNIDEYVDMKNQHVPHSVKITELSNFTRVLPDELIRKVEITQDLFTDYFVLFTDYTGREERKIETVERNNDPVLFGAFIERDEEHGMHNFHERMYYIGDWVDEYCDLTLDKFIAEYQDINGYNPIHKLGIPQTEEEYLKYMQEHDG